MPLFIRDGERERERGGEEARSVRMREAGREVEDGWVTQYWPELSITL